MREDQFAAAVSEYEALDKIQPNNPDNIEQWGMLILSDTKRPDKERKDAASKVWKKLIDDKPDDPVIASQVADLFRGAKMKDSAIGLYKKAIELAPKNPQYREYLGEYYHVLGQKEDAVKTFAAIAAGDQKTTRNLVRLAEVYSGFGYAEEGLTAMAAACKMDPEFSDYVRYSQMLREKELIDDALSQLKQAESIAESPEEKQQLLNERIRNYVAGKQLGEQIKTLSGELESGKNVTAERWLTLSLFYEANSQMAEAAKSAESAIAIDKKSVTSWTAVARIYEKSGRIGDAVDANRTLANLDRRYRTEYLKQIAGLEMRLGRLDEAMQAGRDLIAAAPGNPEHYQFFANLCFQMGRNEPGLDALRRSVRVNPADQSSLKSLASALSNQFRTAEAIELYWRAFDQAEDIDSQTATVGTLTELYLRTNHFDRLIRRLENRGKELNAQRDMKICLATAYNSAGDLGMARDTLQELLTEDSRDIQLLQQLSSLAEREGDLEAAAEFARRINSISSSPDTRSRLANLLLKTGEIGEAEALWSRMAETDSEPHRVLKSIDSLLTARRYDVAKQLCEKLYRQNPRDWESLFRLAVIDWKQERPEEAIKRFAALRQLSIEDSDLSSAAKFQQTQWAKTNKASHNNVQNYYSNYPQEMRNAQSYYQIQQLLSSDGQQVYYGGNQTTWSPESFGQARVAALFADLMHRTQGDTDKIIEAFEKQIEAAKATIKTDPAPAWDAYYLATYLSNNSGNYSYIYEVAKLLVQRPEPVAQMAFLNSLSTRHVRSHQDRQSTDLPPLSDEEIDLMMKATEKISQDPNLSQFSSGMQMVVAELDRAGKKERAQELFEKAKNDTDNPAMLNTAMQIAATRGDSKSVLELLDRQKEKQKHSQASHVVSHGMGMGVAYSSRYGGTGAAYYTMLAKKHAEKDELDDVLTLLGRQIGDCEERYSKMTELQRKRAARNSNRNQTTVHIQIQTSDNNYQYKQIDYPMPDVRFDQQAITMMYNAYHIFKTKDKVDDLFAWLKKQTKDKDAGNERDFLELSESFFRHWNGDSDGSTMALVNLAKAHPEDFSVRLRLAKVYQKAGDNEAALALVDSVEPSDHNVLRDREIVALQLAVLSGNIERARKAAGRLFGLRLDNNTQIQLAAQMHQLGMHDMAEGVLARTRRRAGNQSSTLLSLMQQYQSQGNTDVAVQIAHQILRRTKPASPSSSRYSTSSQNNATAARRTAMTVLARSGELDNLITRVHKQIERSPNSTRLHEILADYYKAAGKSDKAAEILGKVAKLKPDDPKSLLQIGKQLQDAGKNDEAIEKYLLVIKKQPMLMLNNFYNYRRIFENAKRMPDLANALMESDFKKMRNSYWEILNVSETLMNKVETRAKGLALFKKTWEAFPDNRAYLIGNIDNAEVWKLPVMFEYAREGLIPKNKRAVTNNAWRGIADSLTYYGDGRIEGTLNRLMRGLQHGDRMAEFKKETAEALKKYPDWKAGQLLLGILHVKSEETEAGLKLIDELLNEKASKMTGRIAMVAAQEFKELGGRPLETGIRMMEFAIKNNTDSMNNEFEYSPGRVLIGMYAKQGQQKKARDLTYKLLKDHDYSRYGGTNQGYAEYQKIQNNLAAGKLMLELKYPVDALRLCNELTPAVFAKSQRYSGGDYYKRQVEDLRKKADKLVTPEVLVAMLEDKFSPPAKEAGTASDAKSGDSKSGDSKSGDSKKKEPSDKESSDAVNEVVDLEVPIPQGDLDSIRMTSFLGDAFVTLQDNPDAAARIAKKIAAMEKANPDDGSVLLANALISADADNALQKFQALAGFYSAKSADGQTEKPRKSQLALWLVARKALANKDTADIGNTLADLAFAAAKKQTGNRWQMAILRERGQIAMDAGDQKAAEKYWGQMLELVLVKARPAKNKSTAKGGLLDALKSQFLKSTSGSKP